MDRFNLQDFVRCKSELLAILEQLNKTPFDPSYIQELQDKVQQEVFELVVVGQFKRGKTCLINALLGTPLLPTGVVPLTSITTVISYGDTISATVVFQDEKKSSINIEELGAYVTEKGNPKNIKNVKEVHVSFPSEYLKNNIRIIDTPGVGSVYIHNTDVAYRCFPKSDAAIFVLSAEQPVGQAEIEFLRDVKKFVHKIFFVLNKIDILSEEDIKDVTEFSTNALKEILGSEVKLFPLSAKQALEAIQTKSFRDSGLEAFSKAIELFLMKEKGEIFILSAKGKLYTILSELSIQLELEKKAIISPVKDIESKIAIFEKKRKEVEKMQKHFEIIIDNSVADIIKDQLDKDLLSFKSSLTEKLKEHLLEIYDKSSEKTLSELNEAMSRFISEEVYKAFAKWFEEEENKLFQAFENACNPLLEEMYHLLKDLFLFSSDLFDLNINPADHYPIWVNKKGNLFVLQEDKGALEFLDAVITEKVPNWFRGKLSKIRAFLLRKAKDRIVNKNLEQLHKFIDIYAGRVRFGLTQRLRESQKNFCHNFVNNLSRTAKSLYDAIHKGIAVKEAGQKRLELRLKEMEPELNLIYDLKRQLDNIHIP